MSILCLEEEHNAQLQDFIYALTMETINHKTATTIEVPGAAKFLLKESSPFERWWSRFTTTLLRVINTVIPTYRIITRTEQEYGSGVATYYHFTDDIITMDGMLFVSWFCCTVVQWILNYINTDASQSRPAISDLELFYNFIGANGPRTTDSTFFYYSGYTPKMGSYDMSLAYALLIIGTYLFSIIFILLKIGQILLQPAKEMQDAYQLACIVYSWDWGITNIDVAERMQRGTITQLRAEIVEIKIKSEQDKLLKESENSKSCCTPLAVYRLRRATGAFFSLVLLGASLVSM
eukprot:PhF_6_TR41293/c0_g1_i3/m.62499